MAQPQNPNNFPDGLAPQQPGIGDSQPFSTQYLHTQGMQHTPEQARHWLQQHQAQQEQEQQQTRQQQTISGAHPMHGTNGMQNPNMMNNNQMFEVFRAQIMARMAQPPAMAQEPMSAPSPSQGHQSQQSPAHGSSGQAQAHLDLNQDMTLLLRHPHIMRQSTAYQMQQRQLQLMNAQNQPQNGQVTNMELLRQVDQHRQALARRQTQLSYQHQHQQPNLGQQPIVQNGMQAHIGAQSPHLGFAPRHGPLLQLQALKARVVESITQRKALLARDLREMQMRLSVETSGDIQARQAREQLMEEFRMRMVQLQTHQSEINRFNAMSDQDFAAWCADTRRARPEAGQAMSSSQMGGQQAGPSSQPPQPPASIPNVPQQPPMAQSNTTQLRPQLPPSPAIYSPRSGYTPFQLPANAHNLTQSPSMQPELPMQLPTDVRPDACPFAWPTMGVEMFRKAHQTYCQRNSVVVDQNMLQVEGRLVDLHALHTEVLGHGGCFSVSQNELWPVIAAKLGFVQIPGSDTGSAKSGPIVAQHVREIYLRFLHEFDDMFRSSILSSTRPMPPQGVNMDNGGQSQVAAQQEQRQPMKTYTKLHRSSQDKRSAHSVTMHAMPSPSASTSLLSHADEPQYGTTRPAGPSNKRILFTATLKMAAIFVVSTLFLGGALWLALPTLDEQDRPDFRIPKSFAQLQVLNTLLKKYRDIYPYRIVVCYVMTYLFLQAFSLPGSMFLSILGGAVWGVPSAILLVCTCVACGATLCYLISAVLGPALLTMPKYKARADVWSEKINAQREHLISYLIVLRIAPLPPHWVVNVLSPHLGVGIVPFWISTWLGILGVTFIHTTIGGSLDEMTSAADFHLTSWINIFMLAAVVVGVLTPFGLQYFFKRELTTVADGEVQEKLFSLENDKDDYSDSEPDEDIIPEAGPALVTDEPTRI